MRPLPHSKRPKFALVVTLAAAAAAMLVASPPRVDAQVSPLPKLIVDTVKGRGIGPSANPAVDSLTNVAFDVSRYRWPVPASLARWLPTRYVGVISVDDPGAGRSIKTLSGPLGHVAPAGTHGATGLARVAVSGPWLGPLDPICTMEWFVDLSGPIDAASAGAATTDLVSIRIFGPDARCAYQNRFALAGGDIAVTYVGRPRLAGALAFDRDVYLHEIEHVVCITVPCPPIVRVATAKYTFTVTNVSRTKSVSTFSSSCQHDVEIVNEAGEVVLAESDGRGCAEVITTLELAPGESFTYRGELELRGRDGRPLPPGMYHARAQLIPIAGPGAVGFDSFAVKLA
jgi:hypothetical protein